MAPQWTPGAHAFFALRSGTKLEGILIEEVSEAWIVAVPNAVVEGPPTTIKVGAQDETVQVQYLKLQTVCLRREMPRPWRADVLTFAGTMPTLRALMSAYAEQAVESEAEEPRFVRLPDSQRVPGANARRLERLAELYETEFPGRGREVAEAGDDTGDEEDIDPDDFLETPKANLARKAMLEKGYPRRRPYDDVSDEQTARRRQDQRLDAMADRSLAEGDFDQLFKIEMMRMMKDQRNRRNTGSEALELYDEDDVRGRTSLGRAVARMDKMRRGVTDQPTQICRSFRSDVMQEVNADEFSNWRYRDYNRRITWTQFTTMQRMHFQYMELIELMDAGRMREAQAQAIQNSKSIHQYVLSGGNWKIAWNFCGLQDPLMKKRWAGSAAELEVVADWVAAEDQIDKKSRVGLNMGRLGRDDGGTQKLGKDGKPVFDKNGKPVMLRGPKAPVAGPTAEEG